MTNKFFNSEDNEFTKVGEKLDTYEQSSLSKDVRLTFKGNRTFELRIGRSLYRFEGRISKYVPRSVLEHKDFTEQIQQYFIIGE